MLTRLMSLGAAFAGVSASSLPGESTNSVTNPDEQLAFVFELVRHGARAPIENRDLEEFPVGEGLLTPEGMRQRYLLGRRNRERYVDQYDFLSAAYNPNEIYMQSTNVNRTMQSGYSELMGLYPPGTGERLTAAMKHAVQSVAAPPFTVRDAEAINQKLGEQALPEAFVQVAITEFNNNDIHDDVATDGCAFINGVGRQRENDDSIWAKYQWMQEQTQEGVEQALGVDQAYVDNLKVWHDYQVMTDTVVALDFEGTPEHAPYFSDDQWETLNEYQKVWLVQDWNVDAGKLMMSRLLRKPLAEMSKVVASVLANKGLDDSTLRMMLYSAHDTQVVNMMNFLMKDFYWTPYASQVIFELKFSAACVAEGGQEECFGVSVAFNGNPQLFQGCSGDGFTLEGCTYEQFTDYIDGVWYSGASTDDLDAACAQPLP